MFLKPRKIQSISWKPPNSLYLLSLHLIRESILWPVHEQYKEPSPLFTVPQNYINKYVRTKGLFPHLETDLSTLYPYLVNRLLCLPLTLH